MQAPRPGRGRRHRQLQHLESLDLLFVWSGPIICRVAPSLLRNCYLEIGTVRGAYVAMRHLLKFVLRPLLAFAKFARTFAGDIAEDAPEGAQAAPSCLECYVDDRQIAVAEQRRGPFDTASKQIAVRWNTERILERARKMRFRNTADARQSRDRPFLMRGGIHSILRPQ